MKLSQKLVIQIFDILKFKYIIFTSIFSFQLFLLGSENVRAFSVNVHSGKDLGYYLKNQSISHQEEITQSGPNFKVSILTEEAAQVIFKYLKNRGDFGLEDTSDRCYARAMKIIRIFETREIFFGKIFASGKMLVINSDNITKSYSWDYHVAPYIFVSDKYSKKLTRYVFDLGLFDQAVPENIWLKKLDEIKAQVNPLKISYTNRFHYSSSDLPYSIEEPVDEFNFDQDKALRFHPEKFKK